MTHDRRRQILLLEDDPALRSVLRDFLTLMNYQVHEADNLRDFRSRFLGQRVDLVLLDLNLPDGDGLSLLHELCARQRAPVFIVSGRSDESSRLAALEAGADDYIVKPFNARELEFRIRNFLRRQDERAQAQTTAPEQPLTLEGWRLEADQYRLVGPDRDAIRLTRSERDLVRTLLAARGALCTRQKLARAMSTPTEAASEESVTVLIYRLRRKLQAVGLDPGVIETVSGAGYRIAPDG